MTSAAMRTPSSLAASPSRPRIRAKVASSTSTPGIRSCRYSSIRRLRGGVTPTSMGARSGSPASTIGRKPLGEAVDVVDDVGLEQADAGVGLGLEPLRRVDQRVRRAGHQEAGGGGQALAGQELPRVERGDHPRQPDGVHVPDTGGAALVGPDLERVAAEGEDGAHAERPGAEQVGLQRQHVAVAAGHLHDRLEAALQHHDRGGQRRHLHARRLVVGHVGRVHHRSERRGRPAHEVGVGVGRRAQLGGDDEGLRGQEIGERHAPHPNANRSRGRRRTGRWAHSCAAGQAPPRSWSPARAAALRPSRS